MENLNPVPDENEPKKPLWRPWKWIGLIGFVLALILKPWIPSLLSVLLFIYGCVAILNILFHFFRYLKDKFFWRVRNRVLGSFIFVGFLPLLLILGTIFIAARLLAGQLAANYLEISIRAMEHEIFMIGDEVAEQISSSSAADLEPLVSHMLSVHQVQFPSLAARLLRRTAGGAFEVVWQYDPAKFLPGGDSFPAEKWLRPDQKYEGVLVAGKQALITGVRPAPRLRNYYLDVSAPLDRAIEDRL